MNEQINPIEIDRQQTRILNGLTTVFSSPTLRESRLLIAEAIEELERYEKKVYQVEQPIIISLIKSLYELSVARLDDEIDKDTLQDLFYSDVDQLAGLLGIDLED